MLAPVGRHGRSQIAPTALPPTTTTTPRSRRGRAKVVRRTPDGVAGQAAGDLGQVVLLAGVDDGPLGLAVGRDAGDGRGAGEDGPRFLVVIIAIALGA